MKIGFTGTREGMTEKQRAELYAVLLCFDDSKRNDRIEEVHHGMCIGADVEFHEIVRALNPFIKIVGHPALVKPQYRPDPMPTCDEVLAPREQPLLRNLDIVIASDLLIATPRTAKEEQRSGTWTTVRYARTRRIDIRIIEP